MPVNGAIAYLQGLTYPLQPLAWPLVRMTGMRESLGVLVIGILTLAGIVTVFARAKRLPLLTFALAWFAIALAPMWPTLNADYTLNGPRLHYLPSIGTTMIWGSLVAPFCHSDTLGHPSRTQLCKRRPFALTRSASAVNSKTAWRHSCLLVTLAQSLVFLYGMADVITIGGRLTADVSRAIAATPPNTPTLVVNFPSWIGKRGTTFALGAEGISFLPGYSTMREMVRLNTRQDLQCDRGDVHEHHQRVEVRSAVGVAGQLEQARQSDARRAARVGGRVSANNFAIERGGFHPTCSARHAATGSDFLRAHRRPGGEREHDGQRVARRAGVDDDHHRGSPTGRVRSRLRSAGQAHRAARWLPDAGALPAVDSAAQAKSCATCAASPYPPTSPPVTIPSAWGCTIWRRASASRRSPRQASALRTMYT